jgi:hypothetical protein
MSTAASRRHSRLQLGLLLLYLTRRAYLRESLELSTELGYQSAFDLVWAVGIAFLLNDRTATLELGPSAIPRPPTAR